MNNINLIGISGRIGSGKDLTTRIIQTLTWLKENNIPLSNEAISYQLTQDNYLKSSFSNHKFAYKLKQICSILIGCSIEDLENQDFKNKELGKEWRRYYYDFKEMGGVGDYIYHSSESEANNYKEKLKEYGSTVVGGLKSEILTPRIILQLLGTECGRNILHPNIWINALFSEYKLEGDYDTEERTASDGGYYSSPGYKGHYPNWIISDTRFVNEVKAIKDRKGIVIRINRNLTILRDNELLTRSGQNAKEQFLKLHPSETALDNYPFEYRINNNGSIEDLVKEVKIMLEYFNIL